MIFVWPISYYRWISATCWSFWRRILKETLIQFLSLFLLLFLKQIKEKKQILKKKPNKLLLPTLIIYWTTICQNELLSPTQKYLGTPSRKKTWHWLSKSLPDAWLSVLLSQKFTKVWFVFKIFQVLINIVINYKDCKYLPPLN